MKDNFIAQGFPGINLIPSVQRGLSRLGQFAEISLQQNFPDLYSVCKEHPSLFLSPCLFSVASKVCPEQYLLQSFIGYLSEEEREAFNEIYVYSDENGMIYVPGLGMRQMEEISSCEYPATSHFLNPAFWHEETMVHNSIVVLRNNNVFLENVFQGNEVTVGFDEEQLKNLTSALDIIKAVAPDYYPALVAVTKSIVPFYSKQINSFATTSSFGFSFINTYYGSTLPFFIDDLAHQCGHLVFTSLTPNPTPLFSISPKATIESVLDVPNQRSIYVLMHGLFTYSTIATCLSNAIASGVFSKEDRHEALGRLAFTLQRFQSDLLLACKLTILTDEGKKWITAFANCYRNICLQDAEKVKYLSMVDQPYNFSLRVFLQHNPLI